MMNLNFLKAFKSLFAKKKENTQPDRHLAYPEVDPDTGLRYRRVRQESPLDDNFTSITETWTFETGNSYTINAVRVSDLLQKKFHKQMLEIKLEEALSNEKFEEAAQIRDELAKLN